MNSLSKYILFFLAFVLGLSQTTVGQDTCMEQKISFQPGERLQYKVYYNWKFTWMKAGKVDFSVTEEMLNDQAVYHAKAVGKTYRRYEWFYKVNDVYESYLDTSSFKPVHFVRNVREGNYSKKLEYEFDHCTNTATMPYMLRMGELKHENVSIDVSPCTFDLLSIIYYTRNVDYSLLNENDTIPVEVLMDGEIYNLFYVFEGRTNIETDLGTFRCLKLKPMLMDGYIFDGGDFMTVYATDDDNRLPILIESPLTVGSVKAYLNKFDNLRYPMDALIDD